MHILFVLKWLCKDLHLAWHNSAHSFTHKPYAPPLILFKEAAVGYQGLAASAVCCQSFTGDGNVEHCLKLSQPTGQRLPTPPGQQLKSPFTATCHSILNLCSCQPFLVGKVKFLLEAVQQICALDLCFSLTWLATFAFIVDRCMGWLGGHTTWCNLRATRKKSGLVALVISLDVMKINLHCFMLKISS